jgi:hypothetical protein
MHSPFSRKLAHNSFCILSCQFIAAITSVFVVTMPGLAAEPGSLESHHKSARLVLANARKMIEPTLSPEELTIARSIVYRINGGPGIGAFAAYKDGRRLIVISAGMVQMFDWLYDLATIEFELSRKGCFQEYISYLEDGMIRNQKAIVNGLPLSPVKNPFTFANDTDGQCGRLTTADFIAIPDFGLNKAKAIEASIVFLYLHELGHHVLDHVLETKDRNARDLTKSRDQEDKADRYAVVTALGANYSLVPATPWYLYIAIFGGNSIEAENSASHPLGIRRILSVYDETIDYYDRDPQAWRGELSYQDLLAGLNEQRSQVRALLQSLDERH